MHFSCRPPRFLLPTLVLVIILGATTFLALDFFTPPTAKEKSCGLVRLTKVVGGSMQPLFHDGDEVSVNWGFYECNAVRRGDIVVFRLAARNESLVKRVVAVPGDAIETREGQLFVNESRVENSAGNAYSFDPEQAAWLLRGRDETDRLAVGRYLILADDITNDYDSRRFGPVFVGQLVGKVVGE